MTVRFWRQYFQGGAHGDSVTIASSEVDGSGDKLDISSSSTSPVAERTYDTSEYLHGPSSARIDMPAGSFFAFGYMCLPAEAETRSQFRVYLKVPSWPSETASIVRFRGTNGVDDVNRVIVYLQPNGRIQVVSGTFSWTSSISEIFPAGSWVRVELRCNITAGTISMAWYNGESTSPLGGVNATGVDFQTSTGIARAYWGQLFATLSTDWYMWCDSAAWYLGGPDQFIGPYQGDPNIEFTNRRAVEVNTTGSTGSLSLIETSTTGADISSLVSNVYRITPEEFATRMKFTLTASGSPTDTKNFAIEGVNLNNEVTLMTGDPEDFANWGGF